jgi:hypothetical protein
MTSIEASGSSSLIILMEKPTMSSTWIKVKKV